MTIFDKQIQFSSDEGIVNCQHWLSIPGEESVEHPTTKHFFLPKYCSGSSTQVCRPRKSQDL